MKKLWLPVLIVSLILSSFSVFYVAVGAASLENTKSSDIPSGVFTENLENDRLEKLVYSLMKEPVSVYSLGTEPVTVELYASSYGSQEIYEMDYTVKSARISESLPEEAEKEKLSSLGTLDEGNLKEGYTFLLVDVIIENKGGDKQMYLVNSINANGSALHGFTGQKFKNSARLHAELYPHIPFETTLIFTVPRENDGFFQLDINNFGTTYNGAGALIELEIPYE